MGRHRPLDEQLAAAIDQRECALDALVRALISIDTLTERIETLLDRRIAETRTAPDGRPAS